MFNIETTLFHLFSSSYFWKLDLVHSDLFWDLDALKIILINMNFLVYFSHGLLQLYRTKAKRLATSSLSTVLIRKNGSSGKYNKNSSKLLLPATLYQMWFQNTVKLIEKQN